ncbi:MAG: hypothetical protein HY786_08995 [Deltaproteobacteria bacterium]|nr:hypothetical protein [Deltaproteobacteria bacterium]
MFRILFLLLILLFSVSCGNNTTPRTWAILVYMDGDNNLDQAALDDLEEMKAVGSSDYVKIVVQLDLKGVTTKRYLVEKGSTALISDLGELDMAAPQTITDFLVWAKDAYPADSTVFIIWNHGNGWDQGDGASVISSPKRSILYDEDNNAPFLSNFKVRNAITNSGTKIDIFGLDASIMGTIEALYEFRDLAPIIITSQEVGESHGWDYKAILSRLEAAPGMGTEDFSRVVVDSYRDFFELTFYPQNRGKEKTHTISALRTNYMNQIAKEADSLAGGLISLMDDPAARADTLALIRNARQGAQAIDYYVQPYVYVDLADIERLLGKGVWISLLISDATIAEYHGSARPNAHGVSIVFFKMPDATGLTYDPNYKNYDPQTQTGNAGEFINNLRWDEFLQKYYSSEGFI